MHSCCDVSDGSKFDGGEKLWVILWEDNSGQRSAKKACLHHTFGVNLMGGLKVTSTSERKCCRCLSKVTDARWPAIHDYLHVCHGTGKNGYGKVGIIAVPSQHIRDKSRN